MRFLLLSFLLTSCATIPASAERGLLRLEVVPQDAEIFLNEDYSGQVNSWRENTLILAPGMHRLQVVAEGFLSQRFDIEIRANEEVTLRLTMEEEFDVYDEETE